MVFNMKNLLFSYNTNTLPKEHALLPIDAFSHTGHTLYILVTEKHRTTILQPPCIVIVPLRKPLLRCSPVHARGCRDEYL